MPRQRGESVLSDHRRWTVRECFSARFVRAVEDLPRTGRVEQGAVRQGGCKAGHFVRGRVGTPGAVRKADVHWGAKDVHPPAVPLSGVGMGQSMARVQCEQLWARVEVGPAHVGRVEDVLTHVVPVGPPRHRLDDRAEHDVSGVAVAVLCTGGEQERLLPNEGHRAVEYLAGVRPGSPAARPGRGNSCPCRRSWSASGAW